MKENPKSIVGRDARINRIQWLQGLAFDQQIEVYRELGKQNPELVEQRMKALGGNRQLNEKLRSSVEYSVGFEMVNGTDLAAIDKAIEDWKRSHHGKSPTSKQIAEVTGLDAHTIGSEIKKKGKKKSFKKMVDSTTRLP